MGERKMKSLGIRNLVMTSVMLLVILGLAVFSYFRTKDANQRVLHNLQVERGINVLFSAIQDAETAQRGYLLTYNSTYLQPYYTAKENLDSLQRVVAKYITDNRAQRQNLLNLDVLIDQKFKELARTIELAKANQKEEAMRLINTHSGNSTMNHIRTIVNNMVYEESRLTKLNEIEAEQTNWFMLSLFFIAFLLLLYSLRNILFTTAPVMKELYNARESLRSVNEKLSVLVSDLEEAAYRKDEEIERRRKAELLNKKLIISLKDKNHELNQFAYIASHDLQEPLRTVSNFIEVFEEEYSGQLDDAAHTYFTFINSATERMRGLITNLLTYSQIGTAGKIAEVDLNEMLLEIKEVLIATIREKGVTIKAEKLPVVWGYRFELSQLLQNLITNAIKFTAPGVAPHINIRAKEQPAYWEIAVQDNGIGISEKDRERIFGMFKRLHDTDTYQGQGIGLSFCRKIINLHHGTIRIEANPTGGSTFIFTIPKKITNEKETEQNNAD